MNQCDSCRWAVLENRVMYCSNNTLLTYTGADEAKCPGYESGRPTVRIVKSKKERECR